MFAQKARLKTLTVFAKTLVMAMVLAQTGSGKEKNLVGDCVCPEGKVEDANGVCQGTGTGNCTGGRTRDPITKECVCPSDKPNFNEATQQCERGQAGGCTGAKRKT